MKSVTKKNIKKGNIAKTKRNKINNPSLRHLRIGYPLYASKKYEGSTILKYTQNEERKYKDKCLIQNLSWFGDFNVAKSYKTKDTHIYRWKIKKETSLLNITSKNTSFINTIFKNTKTDLLPTINLTKQQLKNINYDHPYLYMSSNEKALYEFNFCFGFISIDEQYQFMKLLEYLIENKFTDVKKRDGESIINKLKLKIQYYNVSSKIFGKKEKMNRLSFYEFDKHAIMNLCKLVNNRIRNISGIYQKNDTSFWFPDMIVYKMNIEEYILFNPHHNLVYDKLIE